MPERGMRVLVTGATGFLGSRLVRDLAPDNQVWAITRSPQPPLAGVTWLLQDLACDSWSVQLPERVDAIVHLAQSPLFRDFPDGAPDVYAVATGATMRLLAWSLNSGARHFVLASTGGLYGSSDEPVHEGDRLPEQRNQLGFYFAAKRASELLVTQYASELHTAILRFFFVYGSGQAPQMLMPRLVDNVANGRQVYLQGEDGIRINPIHVDDAVRAIKRCLALDESRLFNIAGPEVVTLRQVADTIGRLVGREPLYAIDTTVAPNHLVANIQRMCGALGRPSIGIEVGLAELIGARPA